MHACIHAHIVYIYTYTKLYTCIYVHTSVLTQDKVTIAVNE